MASRDGLQARRETSRLRERAGIPSGDTLLGVVEAEASPMDFTALPGGDLVALGLDDLSNGRETVAALLVLVGAPRLRSIGIAVPPTAVALPGHRLYELLAAADEDSAHSQYNALIRRLVSFERAAASVL